jgi:hypothetical protein
MSSLVLFFLLYNITYSIPLATAQQDNADFLTYTNTRLGFTFKYPSDWKIYESEVGSSGFISLYSPGSAGLNTTTSSGIGVSVDTLRPNETGLSLEQYAKVSLDLDRQYSSNVKPLEINTNSYALSGHPAGRIIETSTLDKEGFLPVKTLLLFTLLDNKVYRITYDVRPPENFPNHLQEAQSIIDSFQIINKQ